MEFSFFQWLMQNAQIALPVVLILLASLFLLRFYKVFQAYKHLSEIPGPNTLLLMLLIIRSVMNGTTNVELLNLACGFSRIFCTSGIFRVWIAHMPWVFVFAPELAQIVFTREESLDHPPEIRFIAPLAIGNTVITASPFQEWRKRRKLLNSAFHVSIIEQYLQVFNKHAATFVEKMKQRDHSQPIDLYSSMQTWAMDVICETAMGIDLESRQERNVQFVEAFHTTIIIGIQRIVQPWLHPEIIFKCLPIGRRLQKNMDILNQMSRKIIAQKKARMLSDPTTKKQIEENFVEGAKQMQVAFIDLLLYYHLYGEERLSEDDILGEVNTFIFAGFDTCSLTLSWALYLIGNDSRVQQSIHEELDTVLEIDRDRKISASDIKNMKYLNCVIKETLRLYPPAGIFFRYAHKDLKLNGYTIPKGTRCAIFAQGIHRDTRYFPKPECFIPERFLNSNEQCHPFAYIPFASGPKNCIGQRFAQLEMMTLLASVLRNFSVTSASTRDKARIRLDGVCVPFDPLNLYLTPRSCNQAKLPD